MKLFNRESSLGIYHTMMTLLVNLSIPGKCQKLLFTSRGLKGGGEASRIKSNQMWMITPGI